MFSNAVFHVVGTLRTRTYSPGLATAVLLYIPLPVFAYWHFSHRGRVSLLIATLAAIVGGSYHLWAGLLHKARVRRAPKSAPTSCLELSSCGVPVALTHGVGSWTTS